MKVKSNILTVLLIGVMFSPLIVANEKPAEAEIETGISQGGEVEVVKEESKITRVAKEKMKATLDFVKSNPKKCAAVGGTMLIDKGMEALGSYGLTYIEKAGDQQSMGVKFFFCYQHTKQNLMRILTLNPKSLKLLETSKSGSSLTVKSKTAVEGHALDHADKLVLKDKNKLFQHASGAYNVLASDAAVKEFKKNKDAVKDKDNKLVTGVEKTNLEKTILGDFNGIMKQLVAYNEDETKELKRNLKIELTGGKFAYTTTAEEAKQFVFAQKSTDFASTIETLYGDAKKTKTAAFDDQEEIDIAALKTHMSSCLQYVQTVLKDLKKASSKDVQKLVLGEAKHHASGADSKSLVHKPIVGALFKNDSGTLERESSSDPTHGLAMLASTLRDDSSSSDKIVANTAIGSDQVWDDSSGNVPKTLTKVDNKDPIDTVGIVKMDKLGAICDTAAFASLLDRIVKKQTEQDSTNAVDLAKLVGDKVNESDAELDKIITFLDDENNRKSLITLDDHDKFTPSTDTPVDIGNVIQDSDGITGIVHKFPTKYGLLPDFSKMQFKENHTYTVIT